MTTKKIPRTIQELEHTIRKLPSGGMVLVLNTGALITPESEAMLQALYSRDPRSVLEHLAIVAEKGPEKFMAQFYVGFGHKSIGDCGSGTIFAEGISMLTAKAIQDWMLYIGQEVSTRYLDFSVQAFADPLETADSKALLGELRAFYVRAGEPLRADLKRRFPRKEEEKETIYEKAINARSFDILRSFLPGGAMTSVSWHTNLRQAADKLLLLRHHPLEEVKVVANAMESALETDFPGSFLHERFELTEEYNKMWMEEEYYFAPDEVPEKGEVTHINRIDKKMLGRFKKFLAERPPKTELPKPIGQCGTMQFNFLLDFGSFRDVQRQRAVIQRMPLLETRFGFEPWYLKELPVELRNEAKTLLKEHSKKLKKLGVSKEIAQYYIPMGYMVPVQITGDLPALLYLAELRATRFVHPTLQDRAHKIANILRTEFGKLGLVVHTDSEIGRFDVRRGEQDIVKKGK